MERSCCPRRACTSRLSFAGLVSVFLLRVAAVSIGFCCPTGLRSSIDQPQNPLPKSSAGTPLAFMQNPRIGRWFPKVGNFFPMTTLEACYSRTNFWGHCPLGPGHTGSGGILVDISNSCAAFTLSSPVCPAAVGQQGFGRCLCGGDPGGPDSGPQGAGYHCIDPDPLLSAF